MPNRPHGLSRPRDGVHRWPVWDEDEGAPLDLVGWAALTARTPEARRVVLEALRVAATIYLARQERGWSQRQLAEQTGVSRQTLGNIEAGRTFPDFATLVLVADALKADLPIQAKAPLPPRRPPPEPPKVSKKWSRAPGAMREAPKRPTTSE